MNTLISKLLVVALLALSVNGSVRAAAAERFPETQTRLLQAVDIQGWDDAKLRYAINEMYARHGADFKDKKIKAWFQKFDWYRPKAEQTYDAVELEFTDIEKENVKLLGAARQQPPTAAEAAVPATPTTPVSEGNHELKPTTVSIVNLPEGKTFGDLEVRFADGHTETWSEAGRCTQPDFTENGTVGWVFGNEVAATGARIGKDVVSLRAPGAKKQDFLPNPKGGPFIEKWAFDDRGTAVVIKSRGHHGPAFFIKYDIDSRKVLGQQDGYVPENKMPVWARPYAD
jgi:hypothetical protein